MRWEVAALGGDAALIAVPDEIRDRIPAMHPRATGVAMLEDRVRRAFDPQRVLGTVEFERLPMQTRFQPGAVAHPAMKATRRNACWPMRGIS